MHENKSKTLEIRSDILVE